MRKDGIDRVNTIFYKEQRRVHTNNSMFCLSALF